MDETTELVRFPPDQIKRAVNGFPERFHAIRKSWMSLFPLFPVPSGEMPLGLTNQGPDQRNRLRIRTFPEVSRSLFSMLPWPSPQNAGQASIAPSVCLPADPASITQSKSIMPAR
jgi:hypothetical protein